jgi:cytochrome c peroxidase
MAVCPLIPAAAPVMRSLLLSWRAHVGIWWLLLMFPGGASDAADTAVDFSEQEVALIRSHGPWPPPPRIDAGNRWSGHPGAIAAGARLFADPALSIDSAMSCATCHDPQRGFTDGLELAVGWRVLERNTPTVVNLAGSRWFGWDGAADSLWAQSIRPLLAPAEMNSTPGHLRRLFDSDRYYRKAFWQLADTAVADLDDRELLVVVGKWLAAYQETLVTPRTAFDDFRDALVAGDTEKASRYPVEAQRGLKLFAGRARCSLCHFGPGFTNGEFADVGIPHMLPGGGVDRGRSQGIRQLQESPFNLMGPYNDDATGRNAISTRHLRFRHSSFGEFKIPGLRDVSLTAPYMHNGSLATLEDVVRHYADPDPDRLHPHGENLVGPLGLSEDEIADLLAFLESL